MNSKFGKLLSLVIIFCLVIPFTYLGDASAAGPVSVTILHTNDFHGRLQADSSGRGGSANIAGVVDLVDKQVGARNVLLLDAGDVYFAAPAISQLLMGESTIDVYNLMGYDLAVFGNHEFDKGQEELAARVAQSNFPWLGANVVLEGTEWDLPPWAEPYQIMTVGKGSGRAKVGVLGLAGEETPEVTLLGTTDGLVFKDLTETILHYRDEILAKADALVVVVHMGTSDSGPYKGLVTVAQELIDAGKPVDLMIGGHQHQALFAPVMVGETAIVSAGYYGRYLGRLDLTIDKTAKRLTLQNYKLYTILETSKKLENLTASLNAYYEAGAFRLPSIYKLLLSRLEKLTAAWADGKIKVFIPQMRTFIKLVQILSPRFIAADAAAVLAADAQWILDSLPNAQVAARVAYWADVVAPIVNQPVGATNISLVRDYNDESSMGDMVADSMLWKADLYDDGELNGSVDIAFTNPGGLRADIVIPDGAALPYEVTWGDTFNVLPFANTLFMMDLTGAQIQALLDQAATLYKGILQTSGASWYWYNDCDCDCTRPPGAPMA